MGDRWQEVTRKKSNSVFQRLKFPSNVNNRYFSKEDQTQKISKSVFVINFPDHFSARDLWNVCVAYDKVVDVFIPFKRSKAGKKFAFVRFISVDNLDLLIGNLCTIWIGRFKLHANKPRQNVSMGATHTTFATVLSNGTVNPNAYGSPAFVLDDTCIMEHDFSRSLMGKVKDINALSNLFFIIANEGFGNVKLSYLGGHWVLLEMDSVDAKEKIIKHVGVGLWFVELKRAYNSFVCEERLVWVTIKGLLVKALTRNTFAKIISSWGELVEIDDSDNSSLSYIKVCVKTKPHVLINDRIKIVIKGQLHLICVKELEAWIPEFITDKKEDSTMENPRGLMKMILIDKENEYDHVSATSFAQDHDAEFQKIPKCFTPVVEDNLVGSSNSLQLTHVGSQEDGINPDNIMSGDKELNTTHRVNFVAIQETKMDNMDLFPIKALSGNLSFDYAFSPFIGYSEGILCVWDPRLFVKDYSTIFDSFLVVSGDLNEVRFEHERHDSLFNSYGANSFNNFINMTGLIDLPLEGYSFTWSHNTASKMSKLNRFLIYEGRCNDGLLQKKSNLFKELHDLNNASSLDLTQKAKIWSAIEDDENSKFFHGIINKKRSQLAIRGVLVDDDWIVDPYLVKNEFLKQFANRFAAPGTECINFASPFPNQLSPDQVIDLENNVVYDEIKGDPLYPFLFILIMESLHLLFNNVENARLFKGIHIDESLSSSHFFYADDVIFVGEWNLSNLSTIVNVLKWFHLASGLKINFHKSKLMGIGISQDVVASAASFFAMNRALLFKWVWRFIANGSSLWSRFITAIHGIHGALDCPLSFFKRSPWIDIVREVRKLSIKGIDLLSLIKKKVGNGETTSFWDDVWLGDSPLKHTYPRLYLLELNKHASVASKLRDNSLF
nr:hypothetical protein [Tanacetum cinerariifolium]